MRSDSEDRDPSEILRVIDQERSHARSALTPNTRLLYATWGVAWVVGFVALYLAFVPKEQPLLPLLTAAVVGAGALAAAIAVSASHSVRKGAGSRGPSVLQGAIYGNSFPLAFTLMGLLGWRLISSGVPITVMLSYWVTASCLIVGVLSFVGAAMWNDRSQLVSGAWTLTVGFISVALPPPHNLLAGLLGGLGFLLLAMIQTVRPGLTSGPITRATGG